MDSIKTEAVARHARTIENERVFGKGKIALLLLDREYAYTCEIRTLEAQNTLKSRTCKSMDELAGFLSWTKHDLNILDVGGEPVGETALLPLLTDVLKPD